jgi:hypothetical protein
MTSPGDNDQEEGAKAVEYSSLPRPAVHSGGPVLALATPLAVSVDDFLPGRTAVGARARRSGSVRRITNVFRNYVMLVPRANKSHDSTDNLTLRLPSESRHSKR